MALIKDLNFPVCLAPMVGLSHVGLRRVCLNYLPPGAKTLWWTEMLNSRRLPSENFSKTPETMKFKDDFNLVPQILGNEEKFIAPSVERLVEWGAVGIDINMGCPVQKALKHNYGVALMGDPKYAAEVVRITKRHATVPIGVKLRAGEQNDFSYLKTFVRGLVDEGADWICLHPRTAGQQRRGQADWKQIAELKNEISVPLIGNGDIQVAEDVSRMLDSTKCDLVMSGRGLAARPWMLWQIGEQLGFAPPAGREGERAPRTREEEGAEYGKSLMMLLEANNEHFGEALAIRKFRFHVKTTMVWLLFGQSLWAKLTSANTVEQNREVLQEFFSQPVEMSARTELRQ